MKFMFENALERSEALNALIDRWIMPQQSEMVELSKAFGRITAEDCHSRFDVPVHRVSSFDGIAVKSADFAQGMPNTAAWTLGVDYVFADTGDDFPDEYDTIIATENVSFGAAGELRLCPEFNFKPGSAVRAAGSQLKAGERLCETNTLLRPEDVALLAAGGYDSVKVWRKLRVGFLPNGDELVDVGKQPKRGQNVQSNGLMIRGLVEQWGATMVEHSIVVDDRTLLGTALDKLLETCDIVLVNGGSSRGTEDYNAELLQERASFFSHGVKAVPGRPIGIAIIEGKPVVNIPGPMIAAWLACDWLLRGLLVAYDRQQASQRAVVSAVLDEPIASRSQYEYLARMVTSYKGGQLHVSLLSQGASLAENVRLVNAFSAIQPGKTFESGDVIQVELLDTKTYDR